MILKIRNKQSFIQKFLIPISRINDLCTLTILEDSIYNLNRTPDNNFSLYSTTSDVEVVGFSEKRNISFADIKKFVKVFDCIQSEQIELQINENNIEYKSAGTKFKFHLIGDNIVRSPNFNLDKINSLKYDLDFNIKSQVINLLLKSSTFITDSNKIYLMTDEGKIMGELTDKTRSNIDSYTTVLSESYIGTELSKPMSFNFDLFRNLSSLKTTEIKVCVNSQIGVIAFNIEEDNYKLKYISTANVA